VNTHLHKLGVVLGFKTGVALCGRRVAVAKFAIPNEDASCTGCRAARTREDESAKALIASARERGVSTPECDALAAAPVSYRNGWLLI